MPLVVVVVVVVVNPKRRRKMRRKYRRMIAMMKMMTMMDSIKVRRTCGHHLSLFHINLHSLFLSSCALPSLYSILDLDHASSLERVAYITLHLLKELQVSTATMSAIAMNTGVAVIPPTPKKDDSMNMLSTNNNDGGMGNIDTSLDDNEGSSNNSNLVMMEKSHFLVKLAPRIRRLESDAARCLISRLEGLLINVRCLVEGNNSSNSNENKKLQQQQQQQHEGNNNTKLEEVGNSRNFQVLLITIGHVLRSLALLSKGQDAEATFARVAIMPIVRSRLNVGKLDMGGSRGECAGLFFLLDDIANTINEMYGPILRLSEGMFASSSSSQYSSNGAEDEKDEDVCLPLMGIDLITCGVWVPVATALMADPGIKMAIFSPGMANVLQANYNALDTFLSELASVLLSESSSLGGEGNGSGESSSKLSLGGDHYSCMYYKPVLSAKFIECAQSRLYAHPSTVDYYRRWNLPIYYQLRFAEFTRRLDDAIRRVREGGWHINVYTGNESDATKIHDTLGFELPIFVELYDILSSMWKLNVFLRPLTNRFLRGAVQLVGRVVAFIRGGLEGEIEFGRSPIQGTAAAAAASKSSEDKDGHVDEREIVTPTLPSYFWNERVEDVAAVSWELTILATTLSHDYLEVITNTVCPQDDKSRHCTYNTTPELDELKLLASDIILESSRGIAPLVLHSWNVLIVDNLTSKCCAPLLAVKGVAATYRMTNRPPPTQASPFVSTILRPLAEFDKTYMSRTPPEIGNEWKCTVISSVSDKYSLAVEELIATVKRTEEALKGRATRRPMAGGMSDGEKVKLQLFLDHREYRKHVTSLLGGDSELTWIGGLVKLGELTKEAEDLFLRTTD